MQFDFTQDPSIKKNPNPAPREVTEEQKSQFSIFKIPQDSSVLPQSGLATPNPISSSNPFTAFKPPSSSAKSSIFNFGNPSSSNLFNPTKSENNTPFAQIGTVPSFISMFRPPENPSSFETNAETKGPSDKSVQDTTSRPSEKTPEGANRGGISESPFTSNSIFNFGSFNNSNDFKFPAKIESGTPFMQMGNSPSNQNLFSTTDKPFIFGASVKSESLEQNKAQEPALRSTEKIVEGEGISENKTAKPLFAFAKGIGSGIFESNLSSTGGLFPGPFVKATSQDKNEKSRENDTKMQANEEIKEKDNSKPSLISVSSKDTAKEQNASPITLATDTKKVEKTAVSSASTEVNPFFTPLIAQKNLALNNPIRTEANTNAVVTDPKKPDGSTDTKTSVPSRRISFGISTDSEESKFDLPLAKPSNLVKEKPELSGQQPIILNNNPGEKNTEFNPVLPQALNKVPNDIKPIIEKQSESDKKATISKITEPEETRIKTQKSIPSEQSLPSPLDIQQKALVSPKEPETLTVNQEKINKMELSKPASMPLGAKKLEPIQNPKDLVEVTSKSEAGRLSANVLGRALLDPSKPSASPKIQGALFNSSQLSNPTEAPVALFGSAQQREPNKSSSPLLNSTQKTEPSQAPFTAFVPTQQIDPNKSNSFFTTLGPFSQTQPLDPKKELSGPGVLPNANKSNDSIKSPTNIFVTTQKIDTNKPFTSLFGPSQQTNPIATSAPLVGSLGSSPGSSANIFGTSQKIETNKPFTSLFGPSQQTNPIPTSAPLVGSLGSSPESSANIFGTTQKIETNKPFTRLFGSPQETSSIPTSAPLVGSPGSLFGASKAADSVKPAKLFGNSSPLAPSSLFQNSGALFGAPILKDSANPTKTIEVPLTREDKNSYLYTGSTKTSPNPSINPQKDDMNKPSTTSPTNLFDSHHIRSEIRRYSGTTSSVITPQFTSINKSASSGSLFSPALAANASRGQTMINESNIRSFLTTKQSTNKEIQEEVDYHSSFLIKLEKLLQDNIENNSSIVKKCQEFEEEIAKKNSILATRKSTLQDQDSLKKTLCLDTSTLKAQNQTLSKNLFELKEQEMQLRPSYEPTSKRRTNYESLPKYLSEKLEFLHKKLETLRNEQKRKVKSLDDKFQSKTFHYSQKIENCRRNISVKEKQLQIQLKQNAFQRLRFSFADFIPPDPVPRHPYSPQSPQQPPRSIPSQKNHGFQQIDIIFFLLGILLSIILMKIVN